MRARVPHLIQQPPPVSSAAVASPDPDHVEVEVGIGDADLLRDSMIAYFRFLQSDPDMG